VKPEIHTTRLPRDKYRAAIYKTGGSDLQVEQ
jgi:hypothetical protein